MQVSASVATPESDRKLSRRYTAMGLRARQDGKPRDPGALSGLVRKWWLDGYDGIQPGSAWDLIGLYGDGGSEI